MAKMDNAAMAASYKTSKIGMGLIGVVFLFAGFESDNNVKLASYAAVACFFGIMARIAQAEEHFYRSRPPEP